MVENIHQYMLGTDASKEESLLHYGLLIAKGKDVNPENTEEDEYFVVYRTGGNENAFGTGYLRISELNALIRCEGWLNQKDRDSFLETHGCTLAEWLELSDVHKISDAFSLGDQDIIGIDYGPISKDEAIRIYLGPDYVEEEEEEEVKHGLMDLLIDSNRGIFSYQQFAIIYGDDIVTEGMTPEDQHNLTEDLAILKAGPDDEGDYIETWADIVDTIRIKVDDIICYVLENDGDLWAIEDGTEPHWE